MRSILGIVTNLFFTDFFGYGTWFSGCGRVFLFSKDQVSQIKSNRNCLLKHNFSKTGPPLIEDVPLLEQPYWRLSTIKKIFVFRQSSKVSFMSKELNFLKLVQKRLNFTESSFGRQELTPSAKDKTFGVH
jgi:hypothetical protein